MSLTACGNGAGRDVRAVPTFPSAPSSGAAAAKVRGTLLPNDCADVLSGVGMSALLGQPVDSIRSKAVVGVSAPAVGMLERVTCLYRRTSNRGGPTDVELHLSAYADADAAGRHTAINIRAERANSRTVEELAIGSAPAVLLGETGQLVLIVTNGRSAVSLTMREGVLPGDQARPVMLDLAQRVLPNLAPEPALEPR
ncbi:MAG: hypothetical protein ACR2G2_09390 [Pseudonocardia sp.]